jgi:pimeloyl-ACP methyl ester carboxylesterase
LLDALGHRQPVLLIGHSYGGLMGSLHAAQQAQRLRALLQLDPTPDANDPVIDKQLAWVAQIGRLARLCARLGIPDPVFCGAAKNLPQPEARLIVERAFNSVSSLTGGLEELALLPSIRARIAAQASTVPRLLLSADAATEMKGLARVLASPARARQLLDRIQALHCRQAQGPERIFEKMAQTHGGMVFTQEGSSAAAARIMEYARSLQAAP